MRQTTERHDPTAVRTDEERVIDALHRFAYLNATKYCGSHTAVLDVGFGEGYGAEILAPAAASYDGIEVDEQAVEHARRRHPIPNASLRVYDGLRLPFRDQTFDLVVSFQVIEHVADVLTFAHELRRVLKVDGVALLTTPNRSHRLEPGERPWNRYHVTEYDADGLRAVLSTAFEHVEILGVGGSPVLERIERERVARARRLSRLDPLGLRYRLPEGLDTRLRQALRRLRQPAASSNSSAAVFSVDDVHADMHRVADGLDLLAVARP
jgi:SAM-dependent methyltransferase